MPRKILTFLLISLSVVSFDLMTKSLSETYLAHKTIEVIPGLFNLVLVWNKGAAFGILAEAPETVRKLMLVGSSVIAAVITSVYTFREYNKLSKIEILSLALICGGSIGNLYDRLFLGQVRDFLDFYIKDYHWPAFNIADASITIGIALFLWYELFKKNKKVKNTSGEKLKEG